ncbi:MAG: J domain-containing protein [Acidimicrobiales bacterium]|nr:J domain-containing protein [Acidimicrobiales bacterium]
MNGDRDHARRLLGVDAEADADELRQAYRALMRRHHPDMASDDPAATSRAAALASAYALLSTPTTEAPAPPPPPGPDRPPATSVRADGAVLVEAPGNETFLRVLDALETIGDVTYRDRAGGYLQAIVQPADAPLCTMVVAIEPRSIDTMVLVSLDSMDSEAAPEVDPILHELARRIAGA